MEWNDYDLQDKYLHARFNGLGRICVGKAEAFPEISNWEPELPFLKEDDSLII